MLIVLADHAHDDGSGAYPSVETIGRKARLSRSGTFKVLAQLKTDGHIEPDGKGAHGTPVAVGAYRHGAQAVSYTHLTLPTNREV